VCFKQLASIPRAQAVAAALTLACRRRAATATTKRHLGLVGGRLKALWAHTDQTNFFYLSPSELASRRELSPHLARGLSDIET
jgi:hypothetical protein